MTDKRKHNGRQPYDAADKRSQRVDSYYNPSELELLDKAQAVEMPGKPRGAYVRYAALQHCAGVDTSILERRQEVWYYYHRDQYGREVCYKMDGVQALKAQIDPLRDVIEGWQQAPLIIERGAITIKDAQRRKLNALAALLRAEAAEKEIGNAD